MKVTEAQIISTFEKHDNDRAASKQTIDTAEAIQRAADELGITYTQVRDAVLSRMVARHGG